MSSISRAPTLVGDTLDDACVLMRPLGTGPRDLGDPPLAVLALEQPTKLLIGCLCLVSQMGEKIEKSRKLHSAQHCASPSQGKL